MVLVSSQYVAEDISMKGDIGGSVSKEPSPDFLARLLGKNKNKSFPSYQKSL